MLALAACQLMGHLRTREASGSSLSLRPIRLWVLQHMARLGCKAVLQCTSVPHDSCSDRLQHDNYTEAHVFTANASGPVLKLLLAVPPADPAQQHPASMTHTGSPQS